jgi:uncharacterized repeat protein (TIGR01451 family)
MVAVGAVLVFGASAAFADDFAVSISKGCDGPAYVGDPYQCHSHLQNQDSVGNTYVLHSLVDRVAGSSGSVTENLFALHVPLVFVDVDNTTPVSCTNGSGSGTTASPFIPTSSTTCSLPGALDGKGGRLNVGNTDYAVYTVLPGDYSANSTHTLNDQIDYGLTNSCDVDSNNCDPNSLNDETASGSVTVKLRSAQAVTTILSGGEPVTSVAIGSTVHDSGLVSEDTAAESPPPINPGPVPTGSVSIKFFQGGTCDGTVLDTGSATLDSTGAFNATGMPETLTAAGQYSFQATYGGDGTYSAAPASGCEPLTVVPNSPEISTELSSSSVSHGTAVHDSATLSGATSDAGGTVTYSVYSDDECGDKVADGGTVDVSDGLVPNSNDVTLPAGTYFWQASYSGDANNRPALSGCTDEELVVAPVVDLSITKSGSPATQVLTASSTITWTMVVTNNGPDTDTGVKVSDPMPGGNTYVSSSTTQGTCTGGAILNCDLGTMADGATVTITLVTKPSAPGTQTNTAVVMGDKPETNLTNNTATASVKLTVPKPFLPCVQIKKITPGQLIVGRKTLVTIHLFAKGREVKGVKVRIKGAGVNVKTEAANAKGVIKHSLKMKKKGILTFTPIQPGPTSQTCSGKRIGVRGVFTPPVTG